MSTENDRLTVIQQNYTDALNNEPHDLALANTPAAVTAVQANLASARNAYYSALAADLAATSDSVEQAYSDAKQAVTSVQQARENAAQFAALLDKLTSATKSVTNLVTQASSI